MTEIQFKELGMVEYSQTYEAMMELIESQPNFHSIWSLEHFPVFTIGISEKQIIEDISYETKSCIYCQASASLISKHFLKKKLVYVVKVIKLTNQYYKNHDIEISGVMKKIFNKKNLKRKECIYLPIKALSGALKIENLFNQ